MTLCFVGDVGQIARQVKACLFKRFDFVIKKIEFFSTFGDLED
jgi:hypothetical protein